MTSYREWCELKDFFACEYSHEAKQAKFAEKLHSLKFADFDQAGQADEATIDTLCNKIHKVSHMAEPEDRTDRAKRRIIRLAVINQPFSLLAFCRLRRLHGFSDFKQALYQSIIDQKANKDLSVTTDALRTRCFTTRAHTPRHSRSSGTSSSSDVGPTRHHRPHRTLYGGQGRLRESDDCRKKQPR